MLDDLLVLELASVLAGPSVGQFFAELGATVLKIENPRTEGDVTRQWTAPTADNAPQDTDRSAYFCCCNAGKQSISIDLSQDAGRELLHDLARDADVVLASYRPGTGEALGADYDTLSDVNPNLIYGHVTGYGPERRRAGYDAVIQAESGFMHMNGPADGPPTKLPVALMDVLAAHQLKEGILVALLDQERGGGEAEEGRYVPVSLFQAAVSGLVNQATNWLVAGHSPQRMGSEHPNIAPYGIPYETADGPPIVLAVGTDRQFENLCNVLQLPDLAGNPNFATNARRVEHREALNRVLETRFSHFGTDEVLDALHEHNVPAGVVRDVPAVFEQPTAQKMILNTDEEAVSLRQTAFPHPSGQRSALSPPPHYAQHTEAILRGHLGRSPEQIERLADDEVIVR